MPEWGANNHSTTRVPLYAPYGSGPAPLSTLPRGALEGLPLRAGRTGRAVGEAWLQAGGVWGLQGARSR
jgi:hypothetical protein